MIGRYPCINLWIPFYCLFVNSTFFRSETRITMKFKCWFSSDVRCSSNWAELSSFEGGAPCCATSSGFKNSSSLSLTEATALLFSFSVFFSVFWDLEDLADPEPSPPRDDEGRSFSVLSYLFELTTKQMVILLFVINFSSYDFKGIMLAAYTIIEVILISAIF